MLLPPISASHMPAAHRTYSAVGRALTGFSGQASFSHLSMCPNAYYVSCTYFLQKHLLLPVWANYFLIISAQAFSPLPSTHPPYTSFMFLLKARAAPSAFTFMCFHPSILFLPRLSIYKFPKPSVMPLWLQPVTVSCIQLVLKIYLSLIINSLVHLRLQFIISEGL